MQKGGGTTPEEGTRHECLLVPPAASITEAITNNEHTAAIISGEAAEAVALTHHLHGMTPISKVDKLP